MAENTWLLNDSAPVPVAQEFAAAATAKAWGWFGMPAAGEGSEFDAAASPSTQTYWTPAEVAFNGAETGGSPVTGTASFTESGEALASSGLQTFSGASGFTESGEALASTATQAFSASSSFTESGEKLASSSVQAFSGSGALTESGLALASTSTQGFSGSSVFTESGAALLSTGGQAFTGSSGFAESGNSVGGSGSLAFSGVVGLTESGDALLASASAGEVFSGSGSFTQSGEAIAGDAPLVFVGSGALSESGEALSSTSAIEHAASAAFTGPVGSIFVSSSDALLQFVGYAGDSFHESGEALEAIGEVISPVVGAADFSESGEALLGSGAVTLPNYAWAFEGRGLRGEQVPQPPKRKSSHKAKARFYVRAGRLMASGLVLNPITANASFHVAQPTLRARGSMEALTGDDLIDLNILMELLD